MITPDHIFDERLSFEQKALQVFEHQRLNNPVYNRFTNALDIKDPASLSDIPLLPIEAFKDAKIVTSSNNSTLNTIIPKQRYLRNGTKPSLYSGSGSLSQVHIKGNADIL